jgi:hypothetical protein
MYKKSNRIYTDSIKTYLIPGRISKTQVNNIYASEADLLNVALFGMTAKEWREKDKRKHQRLRRRFTVGLPC